MELITTYFIALTWCGLGMVGSQLAYYCYDPDLENCDDRELKYLVKGILLGPIYLFFWISIWFLFINIFDIKDD